MKQTSEERRAYWQYHLQHWENSGLSGAQYCEQEQITYHCFIYWRSKLSSITSDVSVSSGGGGQKRVGGFIPVRSELFPASQAALATPDSLQLALPNGLIIQNIQSNNLNTVRALLEQL